MPVIKSLNRHTRKFMKTPLTLITMIIGMLGHAQKKNTQFFVFDTDRNPCKVENAKYLGCLDKLDDTTYQWRYYNFAGPLITVETYKDENISIPHGYFAYYNSKGKIDSVGDTREGRKQGNWFFYTDSATIWQRKKYDNGKLVEVKDAAALQQEWEERKKGDTLKRVEVEAEFKGGPAAWTKYIQKNIDIPDRARKLQAEGTVVVEFVVNKDGSIGSIKVVQSVEYSIDEEAAELIRKSPKWEPAIQDGKPVRAYRKQPLTIRF